MLRRPLLALLVPALFLTACGEDENSPDASDTTGSAAEGCPSADVLDAVEVSGEAGVAPALEFDQPLTVETTACRVLEEGDGDVVAEGSTAIFDFVFVNGRDGSEVTSSYDTEPAEVVFNDELLGGVRIALDGVKVGSRVLVAIAPEDGFGSQGGDPESGVEADDTLLFVLDLLEVRTPLERAEGTDVDPVEGQPTVELDEDGAPTITVPDTDPPAELIAQPLIEGEGDVVESGQTITVHYTGVLWDTGVVFDSSWEGGSPVSFPIGTGGVIPGWDKGLVGQPIGSQVLLVIPPADGYGEQGSGETIPPGATLVFVVDILDAHS
jgi:peptidylprolyl isomerase